MKTRPKILVIVGPTASGKTALSIELAKRFNGEVVSADSRQVYRGLDLGTGKVTQDEMQGIPHHLLDVRDPGEEYNVTDYIRDAHSAIVDIISRGKLPIVVGGTFFYVDALLGRIIAPEVPPNEVLRTELEERSVDELFEILKKKDPERAGGIDRKNPRRLIRAIEVAEVLGKVPEPVTADFYDALMLGIDVSREELRKKICDRLRTRIRAGMIDEVANILEGGLSPEKTTGLGIEYRYTSEYLQGKLTAEELNRVLETKSWQYAKRQMTWLKRDSSIVWVRPDDVEGVVRVVEGFLG